MPVIVENGQMIIWGQHFLPFGIKELKSEIDLWW